MSKDRLGDRLRAIDVPRATDAREGAVAEARQEIAGRGEPAPARREGRRRALALGAAALLALVVLLTPPGRSASAWVGELVGIGEVGGEPTQPYRTFGVDGTAVVINNGTGPDGSRYEWVAYECKVDLRDEGEDTNFTGIGLSFEWPEVEGYEGGGGCEELEGRPRTPGDAIGSHGVHILPSEFEGVAEPTLMVSGQTGGAVHDVKVFYQRPDGTRRELPVDFARVEGELRELAHRPEGMGTFVAFLSGDVAARDEIEQRLDLRALMDTGKLKLGPVARRERELAQAALERCERFEPEPAEIPENPDDHAAAERVFEPLRDCHEREMPPAPFVYVAYDAEGREIGHFNEPLVTAMIQRPGDVEPFGREQPGDERLKWSDVNRTDEPVRIMRGRAPEGTLYEVMTSRPKGFPDSCLTIWWPYVEDAFAGGECSEFPPEGVYEYRRGRIKGLAARPWGFLTSVPPATGHYLLSGYARPSADRVRVVYEGKDGRRHDAPVNLRQVGGKLAERIDAREPAGYWLAFLPRSVGKGPTVEVIAYDDSGKILSRIDYRA
jgi:hypothetical protein